jgi:hypothetical protein
VPTYSLFDVGACNCTGTTSGTFAVTGCLGLFQGATVTMTPAGGGASTSGVTNSSGVASLVGSSGPGSYTFTVTESSGRYATFTGTTTVGATFALGAVINPAAGFVCGCCALPIKSTLSYSASACPADPPACPTASPALSGTAIFDPTTMNYVVSDAGPAPFAVMNPSTCNVFNCTDVGGSSTITCPPGFSIECTTLCCDGVTPFTQTLSE